MCHHQTPWGQSRGFLCITTVHSLLWLPWTMLETTTTTTTRIITIITRCAYIIIITTCLLITPLSLPPQLLLLLHLTLWIPCPSWTTAPPWRHVGLPPPQGLMGSPAMLSNLLIHCTNMGLEEEGDEWRERERRAQNFVLQMSFEIWSLIFKWSKLKKMHTHDLYL